MSNGFPKYSTSAQIGERGVIIVAEQISSNLKWLFRRTHQEHDFGVDGYVDIVESDGSVNGRQFAVQIKCGDSYLREKNFEYFSFIGQEKHLNYLLNHPIPVILIICDPVNEIAYWELFDRDLIDRYPDSWEICIPKYQKLEENCREKLLSIAGPAFDRRDELEEYWALNRLLDSTTNLMLAIGRSAVEANRTDGVVEFFRRLSRNNLVAKNNQNKVTLLFYGYDDDERELWEIPEVVVWFKTVEPLVRDWFFFLSSENNYNSIRLLMFCVCDAKTTNRIPQTTGGIKVEVFLTPAMIKSFMERNFMWLNELTHRLGLDDEVNFKLSTDAMKAIGMPDAVVNELKLK